MKRGGFIQRRTPLRARNPFPSKGDTGTATAASAAVPVSLEAQRFAKPTREGRAPRPKVEVKHGPRTAKKLARRVGATAQPLVALEGQQQTVGFKFAKPARRSKAAPAPIKRSWMKKKRARRIDSETPREKLYKAWIHAQPCCGEGALSPLGVRHHCSRGIEQSHERNMTGLGLKSNNLRSVAMCGDFADEWEEHRGFFANWGKQLRRDWFSSRIREANARFSAENRDELRAA